jgi:hypothetical protein
MPHGIALNHETRECGGFWGGDEYGGYRLPEGWVDYYPRLGVIETEVGSCSFPDTTGHEPPGEGRAAVAEACCRELGYTYVGTPVGDSFATGLQWRSTLKAALPACIACPALILIVAGIVFLLWRRWKEPEDAAAPEQRVSPERIER